MATLHYNSAVEPTPVVIDGPVPVDQSALVASLQAQVAALQAKIAAAQAALA